MVMEESIETEDELSRDEVVSCICMLNEENGLMIQVNQYPLGACILFRPNQGRPHDLPQLRLNPSRTFNNNQKQKQVKSRHF
jgi:hypothetical protein